LPCQRPQLGDGVVGPLVGSFEQSVRGVPELAGHGSPFGREVDLLAGVGPAGGDLVPEPGVAAEVRGQPVVQPKPLRQGQREEPGRGGGQRADLPGSRPVAGELQEPDPVEGGAQLGEVSCSAFSGQAFCG
jgi:hypothetical protein